MSIYSDQTRSRRRGRIFAVVGVLLATTLPSLARPIFADTSGAPAGVGRDAAQLIDLGTTTSCAIVSAADVQCWGSNGLGELGRGNTDDVGDSETPAEAGTLNLGAGFVAAAVSSGSIHTCALSNVGTIKCWGDGAFGRLGYGNTEFIGDNETPAAVGTVNLGGTATAVSVGGTHSCAILTGGAVKCWGWNSLGELGYGNTISNSDTETPASAGTIALGGAATAITAGSFFTCALLVGGAVKCWGDGADGRLGQGDTSPIGDDETPASVPNINLGGTATAISAGASHVCALMSTGGVRCWGLGGDGPLGYGNQNRIGDNETPASAGDVPLGNTAISIAAGDYHTCAILSGGSVKCWGRGVDGRLGYGNTVNVGDNETPADVGVVEVGGTVIAIAAGGAHTCVILSNKTVKCWGLGSSGQLGYGNTNGIGDDEAPSTVGVVSLGGEVAPPTTTTTSTTSTTTTVPAGPVTSTSSTTTTVPKETKVKSVRRGSRTAITRLISLPKGKRTYGISGGCRLNSSRSTVTAPKKKATCRLTVKGRSGGKTTTVKATFKVT